MKKKTPIERFLALSDAEKDADVEKYEREIPLSESRALTPAERKLWLKAKRKMGRPKVGLGSKMIPVSIELGLLKEVDAYAKAHKLKRSQASALGLVQLMRAG
jgi:hypothetical protein